MKGKYDFDTDNIRKQIDNLPERNKKTTNQESYSKDVVQVTKKMIDDPPKEGKLTAEIKTGKYAIDFANYLRWQIQNRPSTIFPMLLDHNARVAVDIKNTYKPEKRHMDFQYLWIIILIIGIGVFLLIFGPGIFAAIGLCFFSKELIVKCKRKKKIRIDRKKRRSNKK